MDRDSKLPAIVAHDFLLNITTVLKVPRDVLAPSEQIDDVWQQLPRYISKIPVEYRNDAIARMCVAIASGLFDSAINYCWNTGILSLRDRITRFGFNVVNQITDSSLSEETLRELKDSELLQLCLKLNLISEEGYKLLDQCRDLRNNFSAAHPPMNLIDETEVLNFINRVIKFALLNDANLKGVDLQSLIRALDSAPFNLDQLRVWKDNISETNQIQKDSAFSTLHGIYCDPQKKEIARQNVVLLLKELIPQLTPKASSILIDRHEEYAAKGEQARHAASKLLFQELGLLRLLNDSEVHLSFSIATQNLLSAHLAYDNFSNEPPFAIRLQQLAQQAEVPATIKPQYVETVLSCFIGAGWGPSRAAVPTYTKMIQNFTSLEISIMLEAPKAIDRISTRIASKKSCKSRFAKAVQLLNPNSVSSEHMPVYQHWMDLAAKEEDF